MTKYETLTSEYANAGAKIQSKMAPMVEFTTNFLGGFALYLKVPNQRCLESQFQLDAPRNRVITKNQLHVPIDADGSSASIFFQLTVSMNGMYYVVTTVSGETVEGGTFTIVAPDDTVAAYENIYQTMLLSIRSQYGEQN